MIILGIETSCDETGVALCSDFKILSSFTKPQSIHQKYGGVVPELAARSHLEKIDLITKKPVRPSKEEQIKNSRCRSAKLRVAEKI